MVGCDILMPPPLLELWQDAKRGARELKPGMAHSLTMSSREMIYEQGTENNERGHLTDKTQVMMTDAAG